MAMMNGAGPAEAVSGIWRHFVERGEWIIVSTSKGTPRLPVSQWAPLRDAVIERDGFMCTYCGDTDAPLCADHVIPLSRGGTNLIDNLVCACIPCNSSKSDRLLEEWRGRPN
jgi:5-methylcytosine-specific restriction endonuclease McrA